MMFIQFVIPLAVCYASSISISSQETLNQILEADYSDSPSYGDETDDGTSISVDPIKVKPAPLPFPPDHRPGPPVNYPNVYESKLYASDGYSYQKYGQSIATANDLLAISTTTTTPQSKVYLYQEQWFNNTLTGFKEIGLLSSHNPKQDGFGTSIALSESYLIVGAPQDNTRGFSSGKVFVFPTAGVPNAEQSILPIQPQKGSLFGQALSLFDDTLAIGAPGYSTDLLKSSGAVYIFTMNEERKFVETDLINGDDELKTTFGQFGSVLTLQENFLAVSAMGESTQVLNGGAVCIYTHDIFDDNATDPSGSAWVLTQKIQPTLPSYAWFGRTLAFTDSIAFIAAYNEEGSGVVYVYSKINGNEVAAWTFNTMLLPTDTTDSYNNFGDSLLIFGNSNTLDVLPTTPSLIAVIGSPGDSTYAEMAGAIYVYGVKDTSDSVASFMLLDKLTNNDSTAFNNYGTSIAMISGTVLVGSTLADSPVAPSSGVVYVEHDLIPYYLEVVNNAEELNYDDDDASTSGTSSTIRDALLSTVGIILLALVPVTSIATVLVVVAMRGGFTKHRYTATAHSIDAQGNTIDKDGNIIEDSTKTETKKSSYSYFVNPLKRNKVVRHSADFSAMTSDSPVMLNTQSVELGVVYAPIDMHQHMRSPSLTAERTIYPSPISIPTRPKELIEALDDSEC